MVDSPANDANRVDSNLLRDMTEPLREHLLFILVFVLSAMLSALILTFIFSEQYRASATIFFKPAETTKLTQHTTEALGAPFPSNTQFIAVDKTITQLLDSDALLRQVVADLNLEVHEPRVISGPWYVEYYTQVKYALEDFSGYAWDILRWGRVIDDPVGGAVARLRRTLKVTSNDSYVYNLTASAKTPQLAKAIADDLGTRLVDTLRKIDLGSADERRERLTTLRDDKGREVESIEEQIRDLQAGHQIASLPDELTEATSRASHLQREQADATADLRESDAKLAELTARLQVAAPEVASASRDLSETARPSRLSANDYTRLTADKLDAQIRSRGLSAKLASTDRSGTAANARLQVLAQVQAKHDFLSAQLAAAKRDYAALSDAYEEAEIELTTGQSQLHMQAPATAQPSPISPIKIYHVGAAGAIALIIALGLAYVFAYFDVNLVLPLAGDEEGQEVVGPLPAAEAAGSASARVILDGGQTR